MGVIYREKIVFFNPVLSIKAFTWCFSHIVRWVRCLWFKTQTRCLSRLIISCAMDVPDSQRGNPQWTGLKKCQVKFPQHCGCWHVCMAAFRFRWQSSGSANLRPALRRVRNGVWPCGEKMRRKICFPAEPTEHFLAFCSSCRKWHENDDFLAMPEQSINCVLFLEEKSHALLVTWIKPAANVCLN